MQTSFTHTEVILSSTDVCENIQLKLVYKRGNGKLFIKIENMLETVSSPTSLQLMICNTLDPVPVFLF